MLNSNLPKIPHHSYRVSITGESAFENTNKYSIKFD